LTEKVPDFKGFSSRNGDSGGQLQPTSIAADPLDLKFDGKGFRTFEDFPRKCPVKTTPLLPKELPFYQVKKSLVHCKLKIVFTGPHILRNTS